MRPLTVIPRHAIAELALSPDGQRLGVVQLPHGFRLLDSLTGTELGRDTGRANVSEISPTGRHSLSADRMAVRLAEVTAGQPFLRFQTGWTTAGPLNRPPTAPTTSALSSVLAVSAVVDARGWYHLNNAALTADHRFAVGRVQLTEAQFQVWDLATGTISANLDLFAEPSKWGPARTIFAPDETRVIVVTSRALFVFDLPRPLPLILDPLNEIAALMYAQPVELTPTSVIRVTQPQPQPGFPPFAVLPCGRKALVRGEKSRVELRDLTTGAVLTTWRWGLRRLLALAVASDGLTAAAGGLGGQVVMWDLG
jgi:hypothetical protein